MKCFDILDNIIVEEILTFTNLHPYYTQQLASEVWELMTYEGSVKGVVTQAIDRIVRTHDLDFERLWQNLNRTDRRIMQTMCKNLNPLQDRRIATSTSFSSIKRLMKAGYVIRVKDYEIEDPFFKEWIFKSCM
ncbi:MAG: hypothetical protein IKP43_10950 [Bacteroidaceae bacterium]|jgi:hypothetical protein|nr:hypothetical protein [Bacteroidaceae bacterium]